VGLAICARIAGQVSGRREVRMGRIGGKHGKDNGREGYAARCIGWRGLEALSAINFRTRLAVGFEGGIRRPSSLAVAAENGDQERGYSTHHGIVACGSRVVARLQSTSGSGEIGVEWLPARGLVRSSPCATSGSWGLRA
jgi:hypothetical protein